MIRSFQWEFDFLGEKNTRRRNETKRDTSLRNYAR